MSRPNQIPDEESGSSAVEVEEGLEFDSEVEGFLVVGLVGLLDVFGGLLLFAVLALDVPVLAVPALTRGDGPDGLMRESSAALLMACDFDFGGFGELESCIKSIWLSIEEPSLRAIARRTAESEAESGTPPARLVRRVSIEVSSSRLLVVSLKGLPLDFASSSILSIDIPLVGLIEMDGCSAWYFFNQFSRTSATVLQSGYRNLGSFCIILTQIPSSSPGQSGRSTRISGGMTF